jgi:hypothetical protein
VRVLRVVLLVCLAVLLPLRGAWAFAPGCPFMAGAGARDAVVSTAAGHPAGCPHAPGAAPTHDASHHGHCVLCDAMAPVSVACAEPALEDAPRLAGDIAFPDRTAAVERFVAAGPERPPRAA